MIISASRRTDIPCWYGGWLLQRLKTGEALSANPFNGKRITRLRFSPQSVDALVLWTKNPEPMFPLLPQLDALGYRYYFSFTLTGYGPDWELGLPPVKERIACFQRLSARLSPERVDWRYDPIILSGGRDINWHLENFSRLCRELAPCTTRCILSFFDAYRHLGNRFSPPREGEMRALAAGMADIARGYRLPLYTCAEKIDLSAYQIRHAACIDPQKIEKLWGRELPPRKDSGQRPLCGCAPSIDIGAYDTCISGCAYCYGTRSLQRAQRRHAAQEEGCALLGGGIPADASITLREKAAPEEQKAGQLSLF